VPVQFRRYCAGRWEDFTGLTSIALSPGYPYSAIYNEVRKIPYGETRTYGQVGSAIHVSPRLVGLAMKRNPTPLIIPCHRVVSRNGMGGFSPDPELKELLLSLEKKNKRVLSL
jgi:methylated-DNA-[protein]-cysteine S-methyltransferase